MEIGTIQNVDINDEMRSAYLDYAMSVIVARALPDARDGLKPVHRRILYAMNDMGMRSSASYKKSARIVGEVLGKYHPHGDMAVYDAMARMAQDFSMRYLLIDGQGNFGSIDGDSPAAMRYTEARLNRLAEEMLADIDKRTVDFGDNFDGSLQEPLVLPAQLPNLLLNGSSGIAVGMATNIPPHNLREVVSGLAFMIDRFDQIDEITSEELMEHIKGPDFPTGGVIVGMDGIRQAYSSGRGRIILRGQAHIEDLSTGRHRIVVTEIPYQLSKTTLIERIADLAREGRLDQVSDLRDESDRRGLSIIIELKRGAQPLKVLNQLYKYTPLQSTYGVQLLALVNGEPRLLSIKRALQIFIGHRQEVITRRSEYELERARDRAHILTGLLKALANLDEVIQTIRQSPDVETARERLMSGFDLSEKQAQAILDMQLRRLAALERKKIEDEHKEVLQEISYLEDLLANPGKILALIKEDLQDIAEEYGDERRTRIAGDASGDLNEEDLVQDEAILISITQRGYIKRVAAQVYRAQGRGGRGVTGHVTRDEDEVTLLIPARSLDSILFFSNRGKVYSEKAYQIPDEKRTGRGIPIVNVLSLSAGEMVTAAVAVPDFGAAEYCIMATRKGRVKRVQISEFASVRPSGLIAMNLAEDDELVWVRPTRGKDEVIWVTEQGQALRYREAAVRAMGRQAAGVLGIRLRPGDRVAGMEVIEEGCDLLIVTVKGYGKRTFAQDYPMKGRGTYGVQTVDKRALEEIGRIISARIVEMGDDLTLITAGGVIIRTNVDKISRQGRATRGVRVMNLDEGDSVATVARIEARLFEAPEEKAE
ncbi:MAG TPA: DNA gyrase subunit A [Anaerolineales bacterium]|nr:DNA gyrase subunit A [Anaerolineales bacterium]